MQGGATMTQTVKMIKELALIFTGLSFLILANGTPGTPLGCFLSQSCQ